MNELVAQWSSEDQVNIYELKAEGKWQEVRDLFARHKPDVRAVLQQDVNTMNVQTANANSCEYFSGPLIQGTSTLRLLSNRAKQNWPAQCCQIQ